VRPPEDFALFWEALETVRREFVGRDDLDERELTYGAIRGMIEALGDTGHSVFLTPEELQAEQNALDGSVVGIGVLLGERDGDVIVVSVVPDSPAQRAGVRAGDAIVAVEGASVSGLRPDQIAARVRGDEGSTVDLTVSRPPGDELVEFTITRERIRIPAASWIMLPGTAIGLLRLAQFSAGSADELREARDEAIAAGAESFILDLRGNPGGYVDQAVQAASQFLADGTVYIRQLADGERIPVPVNEDVPDTDVPLVVLVDENTASSAEIMAGALQDNERAPIIGTRTFGTGTVLLQFPLADGSSLRLAIERWLTPEGELIFGEGIAPTEVVELGPDDVQIEPNELRELSAEELDQVSDAQLLRAIELLSQ
jgi:carboxyl-terminal processing protease